MEQGIDYNFRDDLWIESKKESNKWEASRENLGQYFRKVYKKNIVFLAFYFILSKNLSATCM